MKIFLITLGLIFSIVGIFFASDSDASRKIQEKKLQYLEKNQF